MIRSKERVIKYGEVFTPPHIVKAMVDLVDSEVRRLDSRILDPACGNGNFLVEILERRLREINDERALATLYGIDILEDNVHECRERLAQFFPGKESRRILMRNIITCDTLSLRWLGALGQNFDVIIANPPYQQEDGGFGRSARPLYHKFIQLAKKLKPRYIVMIIPSRWFAGGKGLNGFRAEMLNDDRIRKLVDFENAAEVFPNVKIEGGVCYFLWDRDFSGACEIVNRGTVSVRPLNEFPVLVRHPLAVSIIKKVQRKEKNFMCERVSSRSPFGLSTIVKAQTSGDIVLRKRGGWGLYNSKDIKIGIEMINKWKVITPKAYGDSSNNKPKKVLVMLEILPPGAVCSDTYVVLGAFSQKRLAQNLVEYAKTKFFRFLLAQGKSSQHMPRNAYLFVPALKMTRIWTDEKLYDRFELTLEERAYIDTFCRPWPS